MIEKQKPYRVLISGGGTGGHVYPAIAIANKMRELFPDTEFMFVGALGKIEMQKVPDAGYPIKGLWISGLQRKLTLKNLMFPIKLISSMMKTKQIIHDFKPDVVIGVGGYASGPTLKVAAKRGIPTLLQEQNSYAGLTNKLLAEKAKKICVAYENMDRYFPKEKIVLTGNPVRNDIIEVGKKRDQAFKFFGLDSSKKVLFAFGGSLGARTINESLIYHLQDLIAAGVQVIWQIGSYYYKEFDERLKNFDLKNIKYFEFLKEMDLAYAAADVIISRAGALSISEICLAAKPAIFVPSPNVAEDHQTKNAMALVEEKAALLVKDKDAKHNLVPEALKVLFNENLKKALSDNIRPLGKPHAAENIVREIISIIG
ncbi:MAG: undecaprenyldiphospho-muramoylpentapeptide beta-N-acetylglucosaminyltransferase [Cyclobacteriaceae bacterium]|nr:undecaprenyldiphospho-muramoylpentapeptide beta-N-acetylglucosaminyltransferase [Cyclobacteriaceae bacterium]